MLLGTAVLERGPGKTIDLIVKAKNDGASSVSIVDIERYLSFNDCERLGIDYRIYDGKILPFNECEFDYLWSKSVFEHIRYPEITVEECYRILKPGGKILIKSKIIGSLENYSVNFDNYSVI